MVGQVGEKKEQPGFGVLEQGRASDIQVYLSLSGLAFESERGRRGPSELLCGARQ